MHPDPYPEHDQFSQSTQSENTNLVFLKTVDLSGKIYTDQTGRFPVTSRKGNNYILVAYHFDSNTIHAEPLKTISGLDLTTAYQKTVDLSGKIYTDQTGRFPVTSSMGNKYILVAYHFDSNTIHAEPLKTRSGLDLTTAYQKLHSMLTNIGLGPHLHILENECPNVLQTFMREVN